MTDTTQDVNTQAEAQDADAVADQNTGSEQDSQPQGFEALPKATQDEIRKLRREAASLRTKVKGFEEANQSEAEKREAALAAAEERATKAEQRARAIAGKSTALDMAAKANAISPKAVYASIKDDIVFDEDTGEPTNVAELIEKYKADDPDLFRRSSADGGKGGPLPPTDNPNALLRSLMQR